MTDNEIIEHLKNNKYSKAINGLYSVLPLIKQYIRTNNGSGEDAQDIFQDALLVLYKKIHVGEFILSVPLKTYLYAVAKNCWMQELRRRKKLPAGVLPTDIAELVIEEGPGSGFATSAFNLLGEKCRLLLILFYFRKKSYLEIATALAFSNEKVAKNQKYRCLRKAKENYLILSKTGSHE